MSFGHRRSRRLSSPIPSVATNKGQLQPLDYTGGWHNAFPNDLQPKKTLRTVDDSRFDGVGKYKTRQGCDLYAKSFGESNITLIGSTIGAADFSITTVNQIASRTAGTSGEFCARIEFNLKKDTGSSGAILVDVYTDNSGEVGTLLTTSSIDVSDIATSYGYVGCYFMNSPQYPAGAQLWYALRAQEGLSGAVYVSTTTAVAYSDISSNGGQTWVDTLYTANLKTYEASRPVIGLTRVYRPDGTPKTFLGISSGVYAVDDITGVASLIDSGTSSSSSAIRFEFVNDTLYYTDGVGKPRKYDWSSASEVTTYPGTGASNLMEHVGIMFYFDLEDPNKIVFSNFADYEVFTSTDFIYVPAPKKSDKPSAMAKLNGVLYIFTRANKFQLMGQDRATFSLDEAYAQKGSYSQESVVFDENTIYFTSDDGIYEFNGTYEKNIAESIINEYTGLLVKEDSHVQLHNNRLYVFYRPNGEPRVSECFVYNTLYEVMESKDLNTHVGRTFARHDTTDLFIQASNHTSALYYAERSTNAYDNLGSPIEMRVATAYDHFGTPQQLKRIPYWRPILESAPSNYAIQAGFAADYTDDFNFSDVALGVTGFTYDDPASLYDAITYAGNSSVIYPFTLGIFGYAYRWQRVFKHTAVSQPVTFSGEVLQLETKRLR